MDDHSAVDINTINGEEDTCFYIPFKFIDNFIVISTKLNGCVNTDLMVDDGCYSLTLMRDFVEKYSDTLGLTCYPEIKAMASFGGFPNQKAYIAEGDFSYHFGDSLFINYNSSAYAVDGKMISDFAHILSNDEMRTAFPNNIDGIIPLKCFSKNGIVKINFEKNRIEFPKEVDSSAVAYPYKLIYKDTPIVDIPITFFDESGKSYSYMISALLDLGCNVGISFRNDKQIRKMDKDIKTCAQNISSLYGNYGYTPYRFTKITVGKDSVIFKNMNIICSNQKMFQAFDALIGNDILSEYDLWFDYKKQVIYMKPLLKEIDKDPHKFSILLGLEFGIRNDNDVLQYYVMTVNHDEKTIDTQLGDILLNVDNINVVNISADSLRSIWANRIIPNNSITVKRGKDTLVLQRIRK